MFSLELRASISIGSCVRVCVHLCERVFISLSVCSFTGKSNFLPARTISDPKSSLPQKDSSRKTENNRHISSVAHDKLVVMATETSEEEKK